MCTSIIVGDGVKADGAISLIFCCLENCVPFLELEGKLICHKIDVCVVNDVLEHLGGIDVHADRI